MLRLHSDSVPNKYHKDDSSMVLQSRGECGATEGLDVQLGNGGKDDTNAGPLLRVKTLDNVVKKEGARFPMVGER